MFVSFGSRELENRAPGFGDGTNDLPMIRACGTGVAMGNACEELKREADVVCGNVHERGLELALKELIPA